MHICMLIGDFSVQRVLRVFDALERLLSWERWFLQTRQYREIIGMELNNISSLSGFLH